MRTETDTQRDNGNDLSDGINHAAGLTQGSGARSSVACISLFGVLYVFERLGIGHILGST
jgi:hypothetical protein